MFDVIDSKLIAKCFIRLILFILILTIIPQLSYSADLSVQLVDSQMKRENPMTHWRYYDGFFMYSLYKIYERIEKPEYLEYIKTWADLNVPVMLQEDEEFRSLDDMYPGLVMLCLFEKTGDNKYKKVAEKIRKTLETYPRTKDGGFYHSVKRTGELWLDGLYMANVFLAKYGQVLGDEKNNFKEAINQLIVYTDKLKDKKTGLYYHAYKETGHREFFDEKTKHSNEFWGRSIGWTVMAMAEILDIIPEDFPKCDEIVSRFKSIVKALIPYQDTETGLWYQVIDKTENPRNWLETSCTAMFSYGIAKAVHDGNLDDSYLKYAIKGYNGIAENKIFVNADELQTVVDICHGTVVGDLDYYLNRPTSENNMRGLPAVILLAEELRDHPVKLKVATAEDLKRSEIEKKNTVSSFYNVLEYGAEPDGKTLNTHRIQRLIELVHKSGGGTVYFPAGRYLTGTLELRNGVYLELSPGATIYGSKDMNQYPDRDGQRLIYANGASNFGIIGQGTINGNGDFFWRGKERPYIRPDRLILFRNSKNIKVNGIRLLNSPNWNLDLVNCDYVWIDGVTMISDLDSPNSDGIDPTSSSHVYITNCYFELGDDAICPKSRGTKATEYLVVENCVIKSDDSAIKFGTRSEAPIRHCVFNNIIIKDTQYGIAFFAKDGGHFEDIRFSNIIIESSRNENLKEDRPSGSYPLFLDIERRKPDGPITKINDIHFYNITINSEDGHCLFLGQPDEHIKNLYFTNIQFNLNKHRTLEGSKKPRGVRSLKNRAANDYSHIPSNFSFAFVDNVHIDGLKIRDNDTSGKFERHMIWGYDVHGFYINGLTNKLATPNQELSQIFFKDATAIEIRDCRPVSTKSPFINLEGEKTRDVVLMNNNFSKVNTIVVTGDGFDQKDLTEFNNLIK